MDKLSSDRETQQLEAATKFAAGLADRVSGLSVLRIRQLPEASNDFVFETTRGEVTVELTELVETEYARPISQQEYDQGLFTEYLGKEYGAIPWGIDPKKRDAALSRLVQKKCARGYSKAATEKMWLVVFTTTAYYWLERHNDGVLEQSAALLEARKYLGTLPHIVFDEIWFTDLLTSPICVWPTSRIEA
jgi:hypothetical protein